MDYWRNISITLIDRRGPSLNLFRGQRNGQPIFLLLGCDPGLARLHCFLNCLTRPACP